MKTVFSILLCLLLPAVVCAQPILPAPPLPPSHVKGRVIDPSKPFKPGPEAKAPAGGKKDSASSRSDGKAKPPRNEKKKNPAPADSLEMKAYAAWQRDDFPAAMKMWEKLAEKGSGEAMNNIGILYDNGQGTEADPARAAEWFRKSAKASNPAGMNNYARMLEQGRGTERNAKEAASWFEKAARAGLAEAQFNTGVMYERGSGVKKNEKTAAFWYSRAASSGRPEAQSRLAAIFAEGRGVKQDTSRAVALAYGAAMAGDAASIALLKELAKKGPERPAAEMYGLPLADTDRLSMRKALADAQMPPKREDDRFLCDVYLTDQVISGSREMAVCYAPGKERQQLAFVKIDYPAADKAAAAAIRDMTSSRYGAPSAGADSEAALWNLGDVVIATQYTEAERTQSLMYMVPSVYHLTQK